MAQLIANNTTICFCQYHKWKSTNRTQYLNINDIWIKQFRLSQYELDYPLHRYENEAFPPFLNYKHKKETKRRVFLCCHIFFLEQVNLIIFFYNFYSLYTNILIKVEILLVLAYLEKNEEEKNKYMKFIYRL